MLFDFGQPTTGVIQIAFTVPDLDQAMAEYADRLAIGPWTVLRDFAGGRPRYHGQPTPARAHIALGFGGHMQYELIQPADDHPSVHRDVIRDRGHGFHHFGVATPDFDASVSAMVARGYQTVFTDEVAPGARVAYFDTRDVLPGMTELLEAGPALNATFTGMFQQSVAHRVR